MEMEKGESRKRERERGVKRIFCDPSYVRRWFPTWPRSTPLLSSPLPLLSPRKPFDDSPPPLPLRDLRHIAFGMAVRGEREGGDRGRKGGGLIWSWRGLPAGTGGGGMVLAVATESQTLRRCQVLAATAAAEEDGGKAA